MTARVLIWCALALAALPAIASAHAMPTSAVLLRAGDGAITGELRLPADRLAVALDRPASSLDLDDVRAYALRHIAARGTDGQAWQVALTDGRRSGKNLVYALRLTPPDGEVRDVDLRYDVIVEQLVTHRAIVTLREAGENRVLGTFDWRHQTLRVPVADEPALAGVLADARLGVHHVAEGADHLLFLLLLLVPAPFVAVGGRWRPRGDAKRSAVRVLHVVTAFAAGHSITLALGALGVLHPPEQLVECLIALSILVSAVHALRPLVPGGEALIAAGFGLVHGLAFATLLGALDLHGSALVLGLLGFNLGIEAAQLLVVALLMPSIVVLARSPIGPAFRTAVASIGVVLSAGWLLDRTSVLGGDPFAAFSEAAVDHPLVVAGAFALLALATTLPPNPRSPPGAIPE